MPVVQNLKQYVVKEVYYQMSTSNQSFLDMHYFLKDKGIKNNKFFLILYDRDLAGVDPYDPNLSTIMKQKVLRECMSNYWYFIREVVRIPVSGGSVGKGIRYKLHRANLAMSFGFMHNLNMFVEMPRQFGKTIGADIYYLWLYNFGTTNSNFIFVNKKFDDAKINLGRLTEIRDALPPYLRMNQAFDETGKKIKATDNTKEIQHPLNHNNIKALPGARNEVSANNLGRGLTVPFIWYDEFAFIPYNKTIRSAATPAYKRASMNAKDNNKPFGMLLTTTPGVMTTEEGQYAYSVKENATPFNEAFYDLDLKGIENLKKANTKSSMFYISFTYRQLGAGPEYLAEMIKDLENDYEKVRSEVLIQWSTISSNSPFTAEELEIVEGYCHEPINTIMLCGIYPMHIYETLDPLSVPIIGVDVSGGYYKDSSTITVIDSKTTKVCACLNCNYVSPLQLADIIYELVVNHMPNACVNIERNGGFGASVIGKLKNSRIKNNLYYEIKDRVVEERSDGTKIHRVKQKTKVYGLDSSKSMRDTLIDILRERMEYHKDKFISPIILKELQGLEVKKNGRVDHSSTGHDDQIFGLLMALYVWYYGKNVRENFNIKKETIRSDEDYQESVLDQEKSTAVVDILGTYEESEEVQEQIETITKGFGITNEQFIAKQLSKDEEALQWLLRTNKIAREAYERKYNTKLEGYDGNGGRIDIPDAVFTSFYDNSNPFKEEMSELNKQFIKM